MSFTDSDLQVNSNFKDIEAVPMSLPNCILRNSNTATNYNLPPSHSRRRDSGMVLRAQQGLVEGVEGFVDLEDIVIAGFDEELDDDIELIAV